MLIEWREGDVIRRLREAAGWGLEELAAASGVDLQTIHRMEKGRTKEAKRSTLHRIAQAFGLTERQLRDAIPPSMDLPIVKATIPDKPTKAARAAAERQLAQLRVGGVGDQQAAHVIGAGLSTPKRRALPHQTRKSGHR